MPSEIETEFTIELFTVVTYATETGDVRPLLELFEEARTRSGLGPSALFRAECEVEKRLSRGRDVAESAEVWAALARRAQRLPAGDPALLTIRSMHAQYTRRRGRPGDTELAADMYEREWERRRDMFGETDLRTSTARSNYALTVRERDGEGDLERARGILEAEAAHRAATFGADLPFTWIAQIVLTQTLIMMAERARDGHERAALAQEAADNTHTLLAARRRRYGWSHLSTLRARLVHAHALILLGDKDAAAATLREIQEQEAEQPAGLEPGRSDLLLARALSESDPLKALAHAKRAVRRSTDRRQIKEARRLEAKLARGR